MTTESILIKWKDTGDKPRRLLQNLASAKILQVILGRVYIALSEQGRRLVSKVSKRAVKKYLLCGGG